MTNPPSIDPSSLRIGLGQDIHKLGERGPLVLGGVQIEFPQRLIGHSDADVLLHAITDALLGAANLGDIGEWFPDHLPENKNRDSKGMLEAVAERIAAEGYRIVNLDCIVRAELPKLTPHKQSIRQSIARILQIPVEAISVKAKTGEGVDAVGQRLAIAAECVVLLSKHQP